MGAQTHPLVSRDPPACIGHEPSPHIPGCPASVEGQMSCIGGAHDPLQHMSMASGEAFALLLTAVGLYSTDKQVKFEPAPKLCFPSLRLHIHHYSYLPPVETPRTPPLATCNNLGIAFQLPAADTAK